MTKKPGWVLISSSQNKTANVLRDWKMWLSVSASSNAGMTLSNECNTNLWD